MAVKSDIEIAREAVMKPIAEVGGKRAMEVDRVILYAGAEGTPFFCIGEPYNGEPATVGNGTMVALVADSPERVDRIYNKAMELGGSCEGPPGKRMDGFYAAYFRDLDGNKLNAFHHSGL